MIGGGGGKGGSGVGAFPIRQPADGAWKWKSGAGMCALLGRFTEFGRSKRVKTDGGTVICKPFDTLQ